MFLDLNDRKCDKKGYKAKTDTALFRSFSYKNLVKMLQHEDNSLKRPARRKTVPNLSLPISKISLDSETVTIGGDNGTIFQ